MLADKVRYAVMRERRRLESILGITIVIGVTTAIQLALWPLIDPAPFLLFYPAILFAAVYFSDGFFAVGLAAICIHYFFTEPQFTFHMSWPRDYVRMGVFLISGGGIVIVTNALRRAQLQILEDQKRLEIANQELTQFASVAAHDLKAPLNSISQFSDLILAEYGPGMASAGKEYLSFIIKAVKRMTKLIESLLEFATAGQKIAEFKEVDLSDLIRQTLDNLRAQIEVTGAKVKLEKLPAVKGDEVQLLLLFQNLIANSIKYRDPSRPPEITVDTKEDKNYYTIRVEDNGTGFDPENSEKVFEPFKRLHSSSTHEGAGIGLATVKKIVTAHCGEIWVETQPGLGTTFYVKLPKEQRIEVACQTVHQKVPQPAR